MGQLLGPAQTDGQGNEEWGKKFGTGRGSSVQQTVDGGFVVTGYDGGAGVLLLKTDVQRNEEWRKTSKQGYAHSVQLMVEGGFVVTQDG